MANEQQMSKKQLKELKKLEKLRAQNLEKKNNTFKWVTIGIVVAVFLLFFIGLIIIGKNKDNKVATGGAIFANNGHSRMLDKSGKDIPVATDSANIVTLVEYGDIQCPACKAYYPVVKQLLSAFPGQLKLIFKNFPLTSVHPHAMEAAIAAEAAGKQGKYFGFVDLAYENQDSWAELPDPQVKFDEFAKSLGLNLYQFHKDQKDPAITNLINSEEDEGLKNGVNGTPSFFVDGKKIDNPQSLDDFKKIIQAQLNTKIGSKSDSNSVKPTTVPLQ